MFMKEDFNSRARVWDQNPMHRKRAETIAQAIKEWEQVPSERALDFGAGTGLLGFLLVDRFQTLVLMDTAEEMLRVIEEKAIQNNLTSMQTLHMDLSDELYRGPAFDCIFTQMVLHHIEDVPLILERFRCMLKPGGRLYIADLYPEEGGFHTPDFKGHKGLDPDWLMSILEQMGFDACSQQPVFSITKNEKAYPMFLLRARLSD